MQGCHKTKVPLRGRNNVRTFLEDIEEDTEIPIYDIPLRQSQEQARPNLSPCQSVWRIRFLCKSRFHLCNPTDEWEY